MIAVSSVLEDGLVPLFQSSLYGSFQTEWFSNVGRQSPPFQLFSLSAFWARGGELDRLRLHNRDGQDDIVF